MTDLIDSWFVRLDAVEATDISVVNAARVSFGRRKTEMEAEDKGLIRFLMRERHGTPFEHNFFRFHVGAPIFVAREWFRHRSGWSYNEFSGRYAVLEDRAWIPEPHEVRTQVGKPGAYTFEQLPEDLAVEVTGIIAQSHNNAYETYAKLLLLGVAKEVARTVLPLASQTEFYASCNARSLMHFISLRADPTAQAEIRWFANQMDGILKEQMPETHAAFVEFGRIAP